MDGRHDMEALRAALQAAMDAKGIKAKPLAQAAGLGETAVRDILKGKTNNIQVGTLYKIAEILDRPVFELMGEDQRIRIAGRIGAGGQILFSEDPDERTVLRPPVAPGPLIALEVKGDSMFPAYRDGDVVFVRRDHEGVLEDYLGEECAIHTEEGGTFLKVLLRSPRPDRFTLRSFNAEDMEDVEVIWAAPVLHVTKRPVRRNKAAGNDA